jgi:heme-degrading monooxygenase HmoA
MVEIIWEFVVKEGARGQFELAYGPGGAWSKLFARSEGFRGITLLRDVGNPRRYLAVDVWDTEAQREQVLDEQKAEYSSLDASLADWTESRTEVGTFTMRAEAAVRPHSTAGRVRSGAAGRRSH